MTGQKLVSVVIPTRDRQVQCLETLRGILMHNDDMEIIVFDSSAGDSLGTELARLNDSRIRYVHSTDANNITECFEAASAQATGKYVCMIGDDDGIAPHLLEWARFSSENGVSSISTHESNYAYYNWPDIRSKYFGASAAGKLFMRAEPVKQVNPQNMQAAIAEFLGNAGQGCGHMPRIYHGLVSRRTLDNMRQKYGRCFFGVSPDVSFSYLAACTTQKHVVVREPLTISGSSAASNAGRSAMRQHKGDLWEDPHMKNFRSEVWPQEVPAFFSVETVWAQATLAAVQAHDPVERARFNFLRLYAVLLVRHPDRRAQTMACFRTWRREDGQAKGGLLRFAAVLMAVATTEGLITVRKLFRKLFPDPRVKTLYFPSIIDASSFIRQSSPDAGHCRRFK